MDGKATRIIEEVDGSKLIGRFRIQSRFDDVALDIDRLSAGCKTVLNVMYYLDKVFA